MKSQIKLLLASTVLGLSFGSIYAKPIKRFSKTENAKMPEATQQQLTQEVIQSKSVISDDRYAEIVEDPYKAQNDGEKMASMSAREVFILVDRSGSMGAPDTDPTGGTQNGWTRWDSARVATESLAEVAISMDRDASVEVVLWDGSRSGLRAVDRKITGVNDISRIFSDHAPGGTTPLAEALEHIYDSRLKQLFANAEPATVVVLTDGAPNDQTAVERFFEKLVREQRLTTSGRETLAAFSFVRMGDDNGATRFLQHLDDAMKPKLGVDIIDTKEDNFLFGSGRYAGSSEVGSFALFWNALYD